MRHNDSRGERGGITNDVLKFRKNYQNFRANELPRTVNELRTCVVFSSSENKQTNKQKQKAKNKTKKTTSGKRTEIRNFQL